MQVAHLLRKEVAMAISDGERECELSKARLPKRRVYSTVVEGVSKGMLNLHLV